MAEFDSSQFQKVDRPVKSHWDPTQFERVKRENATLAQSRDRQDMILQIIEEEPLVKRSVVRQDEMLKILDEDKQAQNAVLTEMFGKQDAEMQDAEEAPLMERSRELQDQYLTEVQEQQRILGSLLRSNSAAPEVQLQMAAERQMMQKSRERQDKILRQIEQHKAEIRAKRKAAAEAKAKQAPQVSPEERLRALSKQELAIGKEAYKASSSGDKKAYEAISKRMDEMFTEREKLFTEIKKKDPKKADALYDELYLGK